MEVGVKIIPPSGYTVPQGRGLSFYDAFKVVNFIRAEVAVRSSQTATAEQLLNDLRSDYSLRAMIQWGVDPPDSVDELTDLTLTGTFTQDLGTVAAERARELWLTGDRLTTSRRLRLDPCPRSRPGTGCSRLHLRRSLPRCRRSLDLCRYHNLR